MTASSLRKRSFASAILSGVLTFVACKTPTEVVVEIAADLAYRSDTLIAVQIDRDDRVERAEARVITRSAWPAGGTVGTVGVVPGGGDDVVMRVVLATGRDPSSCTAADPVGCIVARRRIHFSPGESRRERIVLRPGCLGVFCDATSSCSVDGACGTLEDDAPSGDGGAAAAPSADAGDPYADAVLADRPRHYYRLDELPGEALAKDEMGRADGTYAGVKLGVTGALGVSTNAGAFFDGTASVTIPGVEDLRGACSIELWARADDARGTQSTILERVDRLGASTFGYRMIRPPGTSAAFEVFRGEESFVVTARASRFAGYSHLVGIVRGDELELWLDAKRVATTSLVSSLSSAVLGPLVLGRGRDGSDGFVGAIDEVAIYDYPLDPAQIQHHFAVAEGQVEP